MRLHRARGSTELREVASASHTQDLWLRNGKVRSQVSGIDRSRFPGRRTVWEIRSLALRLSLTALSTSAVHQALGGRLMRPKEMEDLAAFSARELKRAAAAAAERDEYSSAEGQ